MSASFDRAFVIIVGEEGGYVNDPKDPGGETNFGVTAAVFKTAVTAGILPASATIKGLTKDQAKVVYSAFYWIKIKGDQLQWPLCLFIFDAAINQGVDAAIKLLQKTVEVPQDGILGVQTMNAATKLNQFHCAEFMAYRALRYTGTKNFDKFGHDWFTRLFNVVMKSDAQ